MNIFTLSAPIRSFYSNISRKVIITGIVAFIMTLVLLFTISTHVAAGVGENSSASNATISYESYLIQDGDTLWSIASEYKYGEYTTLSYLQELKTLNGLKKDTIHTGCYILVPVCTCK